MADRVISIGAKVTPSTIRGQGCLAAVTDTTEEWIFEEVTGASEAAAGVGAGTEYPVAMTIEHVMELYWVWRKFDVDYSWDYTSGTIPDGTESGTYTVDRSTVTREAELILPSPYVKTGDESARIFKAAMGTPSVVKYYSGSYYPYLKIEVLGATDGSTVASNYAGSKTFDADMTMVDATVYKIPMQMIKGTVINSTANETLTIDGTLFWAHQKSGGGAKYNTATGAKL